MSYTYALPVLAGGSGFAHEGQIGVTTKYYFLGSTRVAQREGRAGPVTYLYHDHLGSTVASSEQESARYWPYGDARTGAVSTAYQYTGQELDAASGLYYYRARWYDPALGRFIQADSIVPAPGNPQSLNRYAYVYNNPLRYTDPSGHDPRLPVYRPTPGPAVSPMPRPSATPTPSPVALVVDLSSVGRTYISQGHRSDGRVTNDCGPANVGIAANYAQMQAGHEPSTTLNAALGAVGWVAMRVPQGRLISDDMAGATFPWGVSLGFNSLARAQGTDWTASFHYGGTLDILAMHVSRGHPVTTLWIVDDESAHYVMVVGFNPSTRIVSYIDPDPRFEIVESSRVQELSWREFNELWSGKAWWTFGRSNIYVVYSPPSPGPLGPAPSPVPTP